MTALTGKPIWATTGRRILAVLAILLVPALTALVLVHSAGSLLADTAGPRAFQAIVVLGGDARPRAVLAGRLWRNGTAETVVVTGDGDCLLARDTLVEQGVPAERVAVDCLSRDTWTNAGYSASLLERSGVRSAVIVTSWFHTARALRVFRLFCPGIAWSTAATSPVPPVGAMLTAPDREMVFLEGAKAVFYLARAWLRPPPAPATNARCHTAAPELGAFAGTRQTGD